MQPTLIVVTGATASGKTALAVDLARELNTEIISADSRQLYRDIPIATAQPSPRELAAAKHHLVATLGLEEYYSASRFEQDALRILSDIWRHSQYAIVCGGSMLYVDALVRGIDELPTISDAIRSRALALYHEGGLEAVGHELERLDPIHWERVDRKNPKRVIHALEVCWQAGRPYSSLVTGRAVERPWHTVAMHIDWPREQLFDRINRRVEQMAASGLLDEARATYPRRGLNALNTVGLKELYDYFDGRFATLDEALARMAKNTRVFAKKQLTWMKRPGAIPVTALPPENCVEAALGLLKKC